MGTLLVAIGVTVCLAMLARAARPVAGRWQRVCSGVPSSVPSYRSPRWLLVLLLVAVAAADPSQRALAFFLIPAFAAMTVYLQLEFSRVAFSSDAKEYVRLGRGVRLVSFPGMLSRECGTHHCRSST